MAALVGCSRQFLLHLEATLVRLRRTVFSAFVGVSMFEVLGERFRDEQEVGVPRRFSIGAIFVLLTVYCVLFRLLVLLGADFATTAIWFLFATAVTLAQVLLFRGVRPRAASYLAGAIAGPVIFLLLVLDEQLVGVTGIQLVRGGLDRYGHLLSVIVLLTIFGAGAGYLVGVMLAGVFYVGARVRPDMFPVIEDTTNDKEEHSVILAFRWLGKIVNPIPKGNPFRGALALFEITVVLGFLMAPFMMTVASHHVWITAAIVGLLLAYWSANCELLVFWSFGCALVGVLMAPWIVAELLELPFYASISGSQNGPPLLTFGRIVCGLVGLTVSATFGWLQWWFLRGKDKQRFGFLAFVASLCITMALGVIAVERIRAFHRRPSQQLLEQILETRSGAFGWNFNQTLATVDLSSPMGDEEFVGLLPLMSDVSGIYLTGPEFTDESIRALSGMTLYNLALSRVEWTEAGVADLEGFATSYLTLHECELNAQIMRGLLKDPAMPTMLNAITLNRVELTPETMSELLVCKGIVSMQIATPLSEEALKSLSGFTALRHLLLSSCELDDEDIRLLVESLPPRVTTLSLDSNQFTDAGLKELAKLKGVTSLRLNKNDGLTREGVRDLRFKLRGCGVVWSDPNDDQ